MKGKKKSHTETSYFSLKSRDTPAEVGMGVQSPNNGLLLLPSPGTPWDPQNLVLVGWLGQVCGMPMSYRHWRQDKSLRLLQ